nr:unnamed protein product [Callosobruchus analis]
MCDERRTLNYKRGAVKRKLTGLRDFFDQLKSSPVSEEQLEQLTTRLAVAEHYLSEFIDIQEQLDMLMLSADPPAGKSVSELENDILAASFEQREEFEQTYYDVISQIKVFISKNRSPREEDTSSVVSRTSSGLNQSSSVSNHNVKYPAINLPTFSGRYHDWMEFHDIFTSLIHSNTNLSDVEKLYYLKSCLKSEAADVIKSLEVTSGNYAVAWELLNDRFENKKLITSNHIKSILNFSSISKESSASLRVMTDELNKHLRCLGTLGYPIDAWDTLLIYILLPKLDHVSRREWEQVEISGDYPTLAEFSQFLKKRCEFLEAIQVNTHRAERTEHPSSIHKRKVDSNRVDVYYSSSDAVCAYCKDSHGIYNCPDLLKLSAQSRSTEIKKRGLCFNCLRKNHSIKDCRAMGCRKCKKKHHTLLHFESSNNSNETSNDNQQSITKNEDNKQVSCHTLNPKLPSQVLLATVMILVKDSVGNLHSCRALLDCGSQSNFVTESFCNKLQLERENSNLLISGISNSVANIRHKVDVEIHSLRNDFRVNISCLVLRKITEKLPSFNFDLKQLDIPSNLQLADPNLNEPSSVDILLGASVFWQILCTGQISLGDSQPILQKTKFGWILSGTCLIMDPKAESQRILSYHTSEQRSLDETVSKFWEIEEVESPKQASREDASIESHFVANVQRNPSGRFIVKIPFNEKVSELGESREVALKRFYSMERKLSKYPDLKREYDSFLQEYEHLGHMSQITEDPSQNPSCYLPHHYVLKESSTTTKIRVVFDASAKTSSGLSLNDVQMVGPVIQRDLFTLILNFRSYTYVITADCEKMYRQVLLPEADRDYHRILWRSNQESEVQCFTLNTVTYGTASASFLATRVLKQLADEYQGQYPLACEVIRNNFYMDDLLTGAETVDKLLELKEEISQVLRKGGFNLRKWQSNIPSLLSSNELPNKPFGKDVSQSTLGIVWNPVDDTIKYKVQEFNNTSITKRTILSIASQIFDPLGLLSPVIIIAKLIMQTLWQLKLSWDESIPLDLKTTWHNFSDHLSELNNLAIPRHVITSMSHPLELHGYADASERAYGCCVYLRSKNPDGTVRVNLLCAKSKVAPLKGAKTIPKLELCACVILANLVKKIKLSLDFNIARSFYYSDSTIALAWLKADPQRWKTFVRNRVVEIQRLTDIDDWYHVKSAENPADLISRGVNPKYLGHTTLWWKGPSWLHNPGLDLPLSQETLEEIDIPESRSNTDKTIALCISYNELYIYAKFSSFSKLRRVVAYCFRFFQNLRLKQQSKPLTSGELTVSELELSSKRLLLLAQRQTFDAEIKALSSQESLKSKSKLLCLNPFIDDDLLLRVGGRLTNSQFEFDKIHPIILPKHHLVSKLIARDEHIRLMHCGPLQLLSSLRERYWPISGRNLVRQIVHNCVTCARAAPKPAKQLMGSLPIERTLHRYPFYSTGVDYIGPFLLRDRKTRNFKLTKAYVAIFICLATKAIHIELVTDLTSEGFIAALRRMVARRGKPKSIHSDNGTNFVGARSRLNELSSFLSDLANRSSIQNFSANEGIEWHFIPPRAPHFGGLWESGVKCIKKHLTRTIGPSRLHYEDFSTVLTQIEAILNSRPLYPLSPDPSDLNPLTPAHFLIGRSLTSIPDQPLLDVPECGLKLYAKLQRMIQTFWERWRKDYISELQIRTKWKSKSPSIKEGDMVVIKEDHLPPCNWKLGRISLVHPGPDGLPRVVTVINANGTMKRPITKICPLPVPSEVVERLESSKGGAMDDKLSDVTPLQPRRQMESDSVFPLFPKPVSST